jgi:excisionase family DNA binding protein
MRPDSLKGDSMNEWLTPAEAGPILGVGPDRVAQLVRQGVLPAMRTPGGHVRIRRDKVEELANPPAEPPSVDAEEPEHEEASEATAEAPEPVRPKWESVPPWKQRVREAEADLKVREFDDQREQLLEAWTERQAQRERADADRTAAAAEADRLRQLKALALSRMPYGVPDEVRAEVARQLERRVTSERYPAGLAQEHVETLLRTEVERLLRPWRDREAQQEQERKEAQEWKNIVDWAVLHLNRRTPREWDWDTRQAFERDVRRALEEEYEPGMDQDQADDIAFDVLDGWIEAEDENA